MDKKHIIYLVFLVLITWGCNRDNHDSSGSNININLLADSTSHYWQPAPYNLGQFTITNDTLFIAPAERGLSGVMWTGKVPAVNYQLTCRAMRTEGTDFFAGITFPVKNTWCTWIIGGWDGTVVGLSNIDWSPASENITTCHKNFNNHQGYDLELTVTDHLITARIDNELMFELDYTGHTLSLHNLMENGQGLGLATWKTGAAYTNLNLRGLSVQ